MDSQLPQSTPYVRWGKYRGSRWNLPHRARSDGAIPRNRALLEFPTIDPTAAGSGAEARPSFSVHVFFSSRDAPDMLCCGQADANFEYNT